MSQESGQNQPMVFSGLKVLDVGTWIAGPVAGTILGDYGADVIKVELPIAGDQYRILSGLASYPDGDDDYMWQMDGRNKKSIGLNLKSDEGMAILKKLVSECDVYITNHPHPMREKLGLEYEDLKPLNPKMIYASLTAYGEQGPERDREGFDLVAYWARSGLMDMVRDPEGAPAMSAPGMGDHPSAVSLYASIVTALLHRERTGEGSHVHTSLLANGLWAAGCLAQAGLSGGNYDNYRQLKNGRTFAGSVYETQDHRWLQVTMVRTPEEYQTFFEVMGYPDLLQDERFSTPEARLEHTRLLFELATETFKKKTAAEWLELFKQAGLNVVLISMMEELLDDESIRINKMAVPPLDERSGASLVINHPINVEGLGRVGAAYPPGVGEHNQEVLKELGYSDEEIAELATRGVVG